MSALKETIRYCEAANGMTLDRLERLPMNPECTGSIASAGWDLDSTTLDASLGGPKGSESVRITDATIPVHIQ